VFLKLLVVIHRYFVVCLVGVWQRNFEPVVCVYVCVYGTAGQHIRETMHLSLLLPNNLQVHLQRG
jgi:hypothetical protein